MSDNLVADILFATIPLTGTVIVALIFRLIEYWNLKKEYGEKK